MRLVIAGEEMQSDSVAAFNVALRTHLLLSCTVPVAYLQGTTLLQMASAAWYDRCTLQQALSVSVNVSSGATMTPLVDDSLGFFIPPPIAIAHSLIKAWVHKSHSSKL